MRFETLKSRFGKEQVAVQRLLISKIIRIPRELEPILDENAEILRQLGFELENFGDGDIAIKTCPDLLDENEVDAVLIEILMHFLHNPDRLGTGPHDTIDRALHPVFATIACHSVVRAKQRLSAEQATGLLQGLDKLTEGWTCPHGRPVLFRIDYRSIERHFERT